MAQPLTILICALGGEGGGVLAEWLYAAATRCGLPAQCTSIPGVAQRTGATTYYIEIGTEPVSRNGRRPVFSLNPVPGGLDLLVSSELLETARQVSLGLPSAERTLVISSTVRALTVAEKMQLGDGRADEVRLLGALQQHCRAAELIDTATLAREAGTAVSAVLFGAMAACGVLPFGREPCEEAIRASGKGVQASLRGFALAHDTVTQRRVQQEAVNAALAPSASASRSTPPPLPDQVKRDFPPVLHSVMAHALARLRDYQDEAYAGHYLERLARVLAAEREADPSGDGGWAITGEVSRWLALWMAFDDIVRVAHLKLAAGRMDRVRRETGARDDEIVKVYDHFKPGVPELAALMPQALATRLLAWDRRRVATGREPWSLPLKVGTHGLRGALALRAVAALKGQRRRGSRFALEQELIGQWLAAVERGAREHWALGHELAQCGRLVKGYGSTNDRGKENLLHILRHLASGPLSGSQRAASVRAAREAALADEAGHKFDQTMRAHGAPARAPKEQVLRFYKRRPSGPAHSRG